MNKEYTNTNMNIHNIDKSKLSLEQQVVLHLANIGQLTSGGDIRRALKDQKYAEFLVLGVDGGLPDGDGDCNHEVATNAEIEKVFEMDFN